MYGLKQAAILDYQQLSTRLQVTGYKKIYTYTVDWTGMSLCGVTFEWDYNKGHVDVSMPGNVKDALKIVQHVPSKAPQYSPHEYFPIHYNKHDTTQYESTPDLLEKLTPKDTTHIQSVMVTLIY